jgi:hypothetical protein
VNLNAALLRLRLLHFEVAAHHVHLHEIGVAGVDDDVTPLPGKLAPDLFGGGGREVRVF